MAWETLRKSHSKASPSLPDLQESSGWNHQVQNLAGKDQNPTKRFLCQSRFLLGHRPGQPDLFSEIVQVVTKKSSGVAPKIDCQRSLIVRLYYHNIMISLYLVVSCFYSTKSYATMVRWYNSTMVPQYGTIDDGTIAPWYHSTMVS